MNFEWWINRCLMVFVVVTMLSFVVLPLLQLLSMSVLDRNGHFVGLANFVRYFKTPALSNSFSHSLLVSMVTTLVSVPLGFLYAYALTRTHIPGKSVLRSIAMAPLFAPTLLNGIALVYLFGKKGLITTGFLGFFQRQFGIAAGFDIHLYGPVGIILAEVFYTFPQAVLILSMALRMTDARLYEASASLGASRLRTFFSVTLPGIKFGLVSAVFVSFILSFTDFGAPKIVGGNFGVLATDIYKQVIGQQNFVMGATISVVLLIPTVIAFLLDRWCQRKQVSMIAAKSVPFSPQPNVLRDRFFLLFCWLAALSIIGFFAVAFFASLAKVWPYDLSLGFSNYRFENVGGGGYSAFLNSVRMSFYSAVWGTAFTFLAAYVIEKSQGMRLGRQVSYFLSLLPLALPGLVIGLSFIFFFNNPEWKIPFMGGSFSNPFHGLYATMGILVLSNIIHFYTVAFFTAVTALKQLDKEFEAVSESMGVPFYSTLFRVTVPVCMPAILEIGIYYFVNSMATVSAVIFLYSADLPLASVAVANMDDAGDIASAAAMSMLIVFANVTVRSLYGAVTRGLQRRTQAWTRS